MTFTGSGRAPKYLGELIILCLIGWKGKRVPTPEMCTNVGIGELEGARFGAGELNPLGFVVSKCVFSSCQGFSEAQELHTGTSIPSINNTLFGEMCPGWGLDGLILGFSGPSDLNHFHQELNSFENSFSPPVNQPDSPLAFPVNPVGCFLRAWGIKGRADLFRCAWALCDPPYPYQSSWSGCDKLNLSSWVCLS